MKLIRSLTIILGGVTLLFCASCSCETLTADQLRIDAATPEYKGMMPAAPAEEWKMKEFEIESKSLRGKGKISVYVPPGYNRSKKKYPVVYYLHGMGDHNRTWLGGEQEMDRMATLMAEKGDIIPMILVAPDGGRGFWSNYYDYSVLYEDWVVKDVRSYIEKKYRVLKGKKNTVIAGVSMGGFGALKIALRHPDIFGFVCAISPAIPPSELPSGQVTVFTQIYGPQADPSYYRQNHPFWLIKGNNNKVKNIKFAVKCGTADGLYPSVTDFVYFIRASGIQCDWRTYEGMKHDVYYFRRASVDSLKDISKFFEK